MKTRLAPLLLSLAASVHAEERRVPFWPDSVVQAIQDQVDGVATLETVRELGRFHRVHGSPGFAKAADHVRNKAAAAGLTATIERLPADGKTRYAHFRSYFGWDATEASLEELTPAPRTIARFPDLPVALADYSQDADVTAELIDVGPGTQPAHYEGKDVKGKLVLASGGLPGVHRRAVEQRGALGFLSDFPNQSTAWSGDDRDLVRWGHLSPYQTKNTFAFMLSKRQADALRTRLRAGEKITLRARVKARMVPASYDVVNAAIGGTDSNAGEIVLTAHLCHQSAGANDNASGSAAILEVARALKAGIERGSLPKPKRTIRFLWLPEIAGSQAWLISNPDTAKKLAAGIHMDMVGGLLATTKGTFHLSRAVETLPHIVNVVAQAFFDDVVRVSSRYAERGGDPKAGMVWLPGSREAFLGDVRGFEMGSDHEVFEEASFGVPMVYFHDWPDVTIHTNKDQPENLDATKLGRVAYMGAGIAYTLAALPDAEAPNLVAQAWASGEARIAQAQINMHSGGDDRDRVLFVREARATAVATLRSIFTLWPSVAANSAEWEKRLAGPLAYDPTRLPPPPANADRRVPVRNPEVRGPLGVYYYDHLTEVLGPDANRDTALERRADGDVLAYELLNLVDGKRTVSEIRDVLSGRYSPIPVAEIAEYLDVLARADVVHFTPAR
jgi:hypothetical protein